MYKTQIYWDTETTPFGMVLTRLPSTLILPAVTPQNQETDMEDPKTLYITCGKSYASSVLLSIVH